MTAYAYTPSGVCSEEIHFALEDGKIHDLSFVSGCPGNLQALGLLLEGKDAREAAELLEGNDCGGRGTSCADQLSKALFAALEEEETR